jgi:hypothetical protein
MSKKAQLVSVACFALGLFLGVGVTYVLGLNRRDQGVADDPFSKMERQVASSARRAFDAYQNAERPAAIKALSQHLAVLEEA